jgi:cytochrome c oxidase subunit 4
MNLHGIRRFVLAWVALLVLLTATVAGAYVPLGSLNLALALTIAAIKAAIVLFVFMELTRGPVLTRIFAGAGAFWLMILFGLSSTDYLTRVMATVR